MRESLVVPADFSIQQQEQEIQEELAKQVEKEIINEEYQRKIDNNILISNIVKAFYSVADYKSLKLNVIGKGNKERIVYYGEYAEEVLKKYLETINSADFPSIFEEIDDHEKTIMIYRLLAKEKAAEVFVELDHDVQEELINRLTLLILTLPP